MPVKQMYFSYSLPIFLLFVSLNSGSFYLVESLALSYDVFYYFFFQFADDFSTLNVTSVDLQAYFQFPYFNLVVILEKH